MWDSFCVRRTLPAVVTSLGVKTDEDFEKDLYKSIRDGIRDFHWGSYGLDYVAETFDDVEDWVDALASEVFYAVKYTTNSWKEQQ